MVWEVLTAAPAENWHFQAILDAFLMIMIQFFLLILRIECAYTENWKNGGGPAAAAENRRLPPKFFFLPFLAELDNSESFETNYFFWKNFRLVFAFAIFRRIKIKLLLNDLGMSNSMKNSSKFFFFKITSVKWKTKVTFFKKKSWSQMIQICLIRREMQKKIFFWWQWKSAVNGGGGGPAAVFYERC